MELTELKAKAYDILANIEFYHNLQDQLRKELQQVNSEIAEKVKELKKDG